VKIVVAPLAAKDLREARDHIAKDSLEAADALLVRITGQLRGELIGFHAEDLDPAG